LPQPLHIGPADLESDFGPDDAFGVVVFGDVEASMPVVDFAAAGVKPLAGLEVVPIAPR
jgi:hypothetical protein